MNPRQRSETRLCERGAPRLTKSGVDESSSEVGNATLDSVDIRLAQGQE